MTANATGVSSRPLLAPKTNKIGLALPRMGRSAYGKGASTPLASSYLDGSGLADLQRPVQEALLRILQGSPGRGGATSREAGAARRQVGGGSGATEEERAARRERIRARREAKMEGEGGGVNAGFAEEGPHVQRAADAAMKVAGLEDRGVPVRSWLMIAAAIALGLYKLTRKGGARLGKRTDPPELEWLDDIDSRPARKPKKKKKLRCTTRPRPKPVARHWHNSQVMAAEEESDTPSGDDTSASSASAANSIATAPQLDSFVNDDREDGGEWKTAQRKSKKIRQQVESNKECGEAALESASTMPVKEEGKLPQDLEQHVTQHTKVEMGKERGKAFLKQQPAKVERKKESRQALQKQQRMVVSPTNESLKGPQKSRQADPGEKGGKEASKLEQSANIAKQEQWKKEGPSRESKEDWRKQELVKGALIKKNERALQMPKQMAKAASNTMNGKLSSKQRWLKVDTHKEDRHEYRKQQRTKVEPKARECKKVLQMQDRPLQFDPAEEGNKGSQKQEPAKVERIKEDQQAPPKPQQRKVEPSKESRKKNDEESKKAPQEEEQQKKLDSTKETSKSLQKELAKESKKAFPKLQQMKVEPGKDSRGKAPESEQPTKTEVNKGVDEATLGPQSTKVETNKKSNKGLQNLRWRMKAEPDKDSQNRLLNQELPKKVAGNSGSVTSQSKREDKKPKIQVERGADPASAGATKVINAGASPATTGVKSTLHAEMSDTANTCSSPPSTAATKAQKATANSIMSSMTEAAPLQKQKPSPRQLEQRRLLSALAETFVPSTNPAVEMTVSDTGPCDAGDAALARELQGEEQLLARRGPKREELSAFAEAFVPTERMTVSTSSKVADGATSSSAAGDAALALELQREEELLVRGGQKEEEWSEVPRRKSKKKTVSAAGKRNTMAAQGILG